MHCIPFDILQNSELRFTTPPPPLRNVAFLSTCLTHMYEMRNMLCIIVYTWYCILHTAYSQGFCIFSYSYVWNLLYGSWWHAVNMPLMLGLINYKDTKAKCRHLKKVTCKGTSRHECIRVFRLETQSVLLIFSTRLVNCCTSNLLSG